MHLPFRRRVLATTASVAFLVSCSSNPATPGAPVVAGASTVTTTARSADARIQSSHAGAFAAAMRRAPFTLRDFHGALSGYLEALLNGGYLATAPASTSWLDRTAFDATSAAGDDSIATGAAVRTNAAATGSPATDRHLLFAANDNEAVVDIYQTDVAEPANANQPIIGQIALPNYPVSIAVDPHQHLYVSAGFNIFEYTRKSMPNPIRTITLPHGATGIAITPAGTLLASSFSAYKENNVGVYVVPPGATTYASTLADPRINNVDNIATDANGDAFVVYTKAPADSQNPQAIGEFVAGSTTMQQLPIADDPGDVQIDASGNLVLSNADSAGLRATLDQIPSGSYTIAKSIQIESKFDFIDFDHKPASGKLYLVEENVGGTDAAGQIYDFRYPSGVLLDTIANGNVYLKIATAPVGGFAPAWIPPAATPSPAPGSTAPPTPNPSPSPIVVTSSPTPASCTSGTDGPVLDPSGRKLTYGGGTSCVASNPAPLDTYPPSATSQISLYNATSDNLISQFTISDTSSSHSKRVTIGCPYVGSYYVQVTSNVAPTVRSSVVESTKDQNGEPTC